MRGYPLHANHEETSRRIVRMRTAIVTPANTIANGQKNSNKIQRGQRNENESLRFNC